MTVILPLLFLLSYFFIRKVWFQLRKIRTLASIEKIDLGVIEPDLILPEVKIYYKYYFQGGVYFGHGYLLLAEFLDDDDYLAHMNLDRMLVLEVDSEKIISSEHIETYLLNQYSSVFVYIDPIEPYRSRLDGLNKTTNIGVPH
ncbi:hypothetical protein [Leptospira sp. GIMC2001]|uniref:hypothetical protein n=1 Tax=Leptospira sp. GIMC2001 TaxID=1513297 RepID=UPI002349AB77|nr:hypothetical protein [Leptospira sp. GIMC2001]WCL48700.1 hypothetical protein O4O04_15520 [Leptospira sp. GIMC2001]